MTKRIVPAYEVDQCCQCPHGGMSGIMCNRLKRITHNKPPEDCPWEKVEEEE